MLMFLKMIWIEYFVFEAGTIHSVEVQHYCLFCKAITEIALDPSVCEMEQCFWPNCCEFKIRPMKNLCNYASCFSEIQLESCYHKLCCCTSFLSMEIHLFSKMVGFLCLTDSFYDTFHTISDMMYFCQTLALMEIMNSLIGLVRSPVLPSVMQVIFLNSPPWSYL